MDFLIDYLSWCHEHFLFVEKWWEFLFIYLFIYWHYETSKKKLVGGDDGWCLCFFLFLRISARSVKRWKIRKMSIKLVMQFCIWDCVVCVGATWSLNKNICACVFRTSLYFKPNYLIHFQYQLTWYGKTK
jgi:hypothetical protein